VQTPWYERGRFGCHLISTAERGEKGKNREIKTKGRERERGVEAVLDRNGNVGINGLPHNHAECQKKLLHQNERRRGKNFHTAVYPLLGKEKNSTKHERSRLSENEKEGHSKRPRQKKEGLLRL